MFRPFFGLHLNLGKTTLKVSVKTFFFFCLHLICLPEKDHPPMLKIGQNWDKIANYLPQCSTKIGTSV